MIGACLRAELAHCSLGASWADLAECRPSKRLVRFGAFWKKMEEKDGEKEGEKE